jgi:hypothetical protein
MKVELKFFASSPFAANGVDPVEVFEDVKEVHYNYNGRGMVAIELETTGYTYPLKYVEEFEVTN